MKSYLKDGNLTSNPGIQAREFRAKYKLEDITPHDTKSNIIQNTMPNIAVNALKTHLEEPNIVGIHNGKLLPDDPDTTEFYQNSQLYNGFNLTYHRRHELLNPQFQTENNPFSSNSGIQEQLLNQTDKVLPFALDNFEEISYMAQDEKYESFKKPGSARYTEYLVHPHLKYVEAKIMKQLRKGITQPIHKRQEVVFKNKRLHDYINDRNKNGFRNNEYLGKNVVEYDVHKVVTNASPTSTSIPIVPSSVVYHSTVTPAKNPFITTLSTGRQLPTVGLLKMQHSSMMYNLDQSVKKTPNKKIKPYEDIIEKRKKEYSPRVDLFFAKEERKNKYLEQGKVKKTHKMSLRNQMRGIISEFDEIV